MTASSVPTNPTPNTSKTKAPKSEAQSHKPTFGESAEKPGTEQTEPEGDPTSADPVEKLKSVEDSKKSEQDEVKPFNAKKADEHDAPSEVKSRLSDLQSEQENQQNPDKFQKDIHQPTTENHTAAPQSRPKTIDPATGHIHYVGDAAALPGGTVAKEGDA